MAAPKKVLLKEISLWKKRFTTSKKVLNDVYKDVAKEARKTMKEVTK